jgi:hypothetical protein
MNLPSPEETHPTLHVFLARLHLVEGWPGFTNFRQNDAKSLSVEQFASIPELQADFDA